MTTVTWVGGANGAGADQGRWTVGSDWSGGAVPQAGDLVSIDGVANTGIDHIGPIISFPIGGVYTSIYLFPKPRFIGQGMHPARLRPLLISGETIEVNGAAGPPELWLQKTTLQNVDIQATGTVALESYLSNDISGTVQVGGTGGSAFVQLVLYGADVQGYGIAGTTAFTTLAGAVTIAGGSTFQVESLAQAQAPAGLASSGVIDVAAGGSLLIDDTDGFGITTPADNGLTVQNTGTILLAGAAGQTTTTTITANLAGSGTIDVEAGGAAGSITLTLNGNVHDQNLILNGGTIAVNDAETVNSDPIEKGFSVRGGSFTFGAAGGTLVLHQPPLTTLQFVDGGTELQQVPDGQHPFTTPIYGFGAGDAIELVDKYVAGYSHDVVSWEQDKHFLQVENPAGIAGYPPEIEAAFTLEGTYTASRFQLTGDPHTGLLTLAYHG